MLIFLTQTLALTLISVTSWFTQLLRAFHVSSHLTSRKSWHILGIQYLILAQSVNELVSDLTNNDLTGYWWALNEMEQYKTLQRTWHSPTTYTQNSVRILFCSPKPTGFSVPQLFLPTQLKCQHFFYSKALPDFGKLPSLPTKTSFQSKR